MRARPRPPDRDADGPVPLRADRERQQADPLARLVRRATRWPRPRPHGSRFDRSFLAIAAAANGLGVALESTRLAERELASGRLARPLAGRAEDVRYVAHHLVFPRAATRRHTVRLFTRWLSTELGLELEPVF